MGRPKKDLSPEQLKQVTKMAGYGLSQQHICDIFGINVETLRKYAVNEYNRGKATGIEALMEAAQIRAIRGSDQLLKFLLATRCGLSEKTIIENQGQAAGAQVLKVVFEEAPPSTRKPNANTQGDS